MPPFQNKEQEWQKLRREVQQHNDPEATRQDYANANKNADIKTQPHEQRIARLEERQSVLEERVSTRAASISAMLELIERELAVLVTRREFEHVRYITYGISFSIIAGGTFALIFRAAAK